MSKELDALERGILEFEKDLEDDPNNEWLKRVVAGMKKCYQRLEAIDNANPSEALEGLERIDNTLCLNNMKGKLEFGIDTEEHTDCDSVIGMTEDLESIKQSLLKAQENENRINIEIESKAKIIKHNFAFQKENAELKRVLEILKPDLRLVGNFLQAKMPLVDNDSWINIKEITDEKELDTLKKIL